MGPHCPDAARWDAFVKVNNLGAVRVLPFGFSFFYSIVALVSKGIPFFLIVLTSYYESEIVYKNLFEYVWNNLLDQIFVIEQIHVFTVIRSEYTSI